MNDLEREIRDALLHHQGDAPPLDLSDARRIAGRARRRQARNVVAAVVTGAAVVMALAGPGGVLRADRSPMLDQPPMSPSPVVTPSVHGGDGRAGSVDGWPGRTRNQAGVYSWDAGTSAYTGEGFMHNGYKPGSGLVNIIFEGDPGHLIPHRGQTPVTVAGYDGTYRRYVGDEGPWRDIAEGGEIEEWMVDIEGTTVTFLVIAEPGAPLAESAEAHDIIASIEMEPAVNDLGFHLLFTLTTNTWDSG